MRRPPPTAKKHQTHAALKNAFCCLRELAAVVTASPRSSRTLCHLLRATTAFNAACAMLSGHLFTMKIRPPRFHHTNGCTHSAPLHTWHLKKSSSHTVQKAVSTASPFSFIPSQPSHQLPVIKPQSMQGETYGGNVFGISLTTTASWALPGADAMACTASGGSRLSLNTAGAYPHICGIHIWGNTAFNILFLAVLNPKELVPLTAACSRPRAHSMPRGEHKHNATTCNPCQ